MKIMSHLGQRKTFLRMAGLCKEKEPGNLQKSAFNYVHIHIKPCSYT